MQAEDLILVTGATGNTGSALLRQLEACGARVRAMIRSHKDEARLGGTAAATAVANFDDPASLASALEGVTRAYLVTPSSPQAETQQVRFAEQVVAAGVKHLVKLSQFAANETSPVRFLRYHAAVERRIRELGVGFTFLRGLVEDYAHYARGEAETVSTHVREVTGADPRDMGEFAQDYARAFVGA